MRTRASATPGSGTPRSARTKSASAAKTAYVVKRNCSTCGGGCDIGEDGQEYCSEPYECGCERYCIVHEYAWATYEWEEMNALGHESTGDCGTCYDFYNWYDGDGNLHFGDVSKISFYQSQPLLVQP